MLGNGLLQRYYNGVSAQAIMDAFPEHPWQQWRFHRFQNPAWWREPSNQRAFLTWLAEIKGAKNINELRSMSVDGIRRAGGRFLDFYQNDIGNAIEALFPESIKSEEAVAIIKGIQQRRFTELGRTLGAKSLEDWYSVTRADLIRAGGSWYCTLPYMVNLIVVPFIGLKEVSKHGSAASFAKAVWPNHPWEVWRFSHTPDNYWDRIESHREFMDAAYKELKLTGVDGWYTVSEAKLVSFGGAAMLKRYRGVANAIMTIYPSHHWRPWLFISPPTMCVGILRCHTKQRYVLI
jgi:hypothetical protein